jgi:alpha-tubulin suppressor-like RCC1 family protein
MAAYPNLELTYEYLMSKMNILRAEIDQPEPRLVKNNLIFYKFSKLICGPFNTALVTDKGELLLQGMNDSGQLAMGKELGPMVPFFPEFRKIDNMKVKDVALGAASCHILTEDGKMHAVGDNEWGQHGNGTKLQSHVIQEVSCGHKFQSIAAGAWHVLA